VALFRCTIWLNRS